ncbi:MAG: helix-turn-helix domain-containing protein [Bacteroidetes bacterium]|nr:helix-turn-helix domain-containing protein [Bacteroidota bacterium]
MNSFSEELRAHRISKNIPLFEIAARTKINIKYLESIEQGVFDFLPIPFARAVLRQYTEFIEYPTNEALKKFDVIVGKSQDEYTQPLNVPLYSTANIPTTEEKSLAEKISSHNKEESKKDQNIRRNFAIASIALLLIVLSIYIFQFAFEEDVIVKEEDFTKVVEQVEAPKTTEEVKLPTPVNVENDSLQLIVTSLDSVWFSISSDELLPKDYLLGKNITKVFRAKKYFIVSAGVGIHVKFKLNDRDLGVLGSRGKVLRNVKIDKDFFAP